MNHALTRRIIDHSTKETFSFSYYCDICGKVWSSWVSGAPENAPITIDDEARSLIWNDAHKVAFEQASLEAMFHFNRCPECGKWVCDDCFDPEWNGGMGRCKECAARDPGSKESALHSTDTQRGKPMSTGK